MSAACHLLAVGAYAGFQWTVQGVVYRQFPLVADFAPYERAHQQLIARVVGPLFLAQLVTTGWLLVARPHGAGWPVVSAALLLVVLGSTAGAAVPLHRRLGDGFDQAAWRQLLRVDGVRTAAATLNAAVALVIAVQ